MRYSFNFSSAVFLLLGVFFVSIVSAKGNERWSKPDYLVDSFVEIALNNEYSRKQSSVRKWIKPVKYYFVHHVSDQGLHEQLSKLHLEHLTNITGVEIQQVSKKQNANLLIVFSTESQFEKELQTEFNIKSQKQRGRLSRNSICLANFTTYKNGSINKAVVIIPVDRARAHAKLVSCIVEELTQVMGLPNDSEKVFPSVFNDKSYNDLLSGLDFLLLKMLYHPRVKPGMNKHVLKPVLKKIIEELEEQDIIAQAEKKVMTGGLYPLLN